MSLFSSVPLFRFSVFGYFYYFLQLFFRYSKARFQPLHICVGKEAVLGTIHSTILIRRVLGRRKLYYYFKGSIAYNVRRMCAGLL
jgi:hypothetical protein